MQLNERNISVKADELIHYEFSNDYLPKISLKLEYLLSNVEQACEETHPVVHYEALKCTLKLLKIAEKPELKSRFLKEYVRLAHSMSKISSQQENSDYRLLQEQIYDLNHMGGRFGDALHQNPFLQSVRMAQTSEPFEFTLLCPQLIYWLHSSPAERCNNLKQWLECFYTLYNTVSIYLSLLRESAIEEDFYIHGSYCQFPIQKQAYQLIILKIPNKQPLIPNIQLGHHGLSLRLCDKNTLQEIPSQTTYLQIGVCKI